MIYIFEYCVLLRYIGYYVLWTEGIVSVVMMAHVIGYILCKHNEFNAPRGIWRIGTCNVLVHFITFFFQSNSQ